MQLGTECFNFGVERFCRSISLTMEEIVEDLSLSLEDSGGYSIEVLVVKLCNVIKPLSKTFLARFLGRVSLAEYHTQAMSQTIGSLDVRIALKQKAGTGLLAFGPLL